MQAAIGNLFVGAFARLLPFVNGIIMVIKELARTIAAFFGIEMQDFNTGIATYEDDLGDYADGLDDIGSSAGSASSKIKELNRQVLKFDQINNLTTPKPTSSSGGSSGGGLLGAIDDKLLAALEGYENGMEKVRMKAVEIRDTIMEWLGFTKEIDEETHELNFTYDTTGKTIVQVAKEVAHNLANMLNYYTNQIDWAQLGEYLAIGLNTAFGFIDTFVQNYNWNNLGKKIGEFLNKAIKDTDFSTIGRVLTDKLKIAIETLSGLIEEFNFVEFADNLANLINSAIENIPISSLVNGLNALADGIWATLKELFIKVNWGELVDDIISVVEGLDWDTKLLVLAPIIASAMSSLFGSSLVQGAIIKSISEAIASGATGAGTAGAGATAAGAGASGSALGGLGMGAAVVIGAIFQIKGFTTEHKLLQKVLNGEPAVLEFTPDLSGFVEAIITALGAVSIAITPVKYFAGILAIVETISSVMKNGIAGTVKNIINSIEKLFGLSQNSLFGKLPNWFFELTGFIDGANNALYGFGMMTNGVSEDVKQNAQKYFDTMIEADKQQRLLKASTEKNYEEMEKIVKETTDESAEHIKNSLVEQTKAVEGSLGEELINQWGILAYSNREKYKDGIKDLPDDVKDQIQAATGVVVIATPQMAEEFANLSNTSEQEFMEKFKKLPEDIQNELLPMILEKGGKIPPELQEGIDSKPNPKIDLDTPTKEENQAKVNNSLVGVLGWAQIAFNLPSQWSVANAVNNLMSGVSGLLNISFGYGNGGGFRANGGVFANGNWQPIQAYANGGVPSGGQMFIAREAGPELVGRIGKHTAVMNNNQIVDSVKAGVYEAVSAAMSEGGMGSVQIDLHTDEGVVVDRINRITRQTGNCPIEI